VRKAAFVIENLPSVFFHLFVTIVAQHGWQVKQAGMAIGSSLPIPATVAILRRAAMRRRGMR
jgi:hypothetical protein